MLTVRTTILSSCFAALVVFSGNVVSAQDLVYTPINPSFGGNPFNSSHLLGIANAQNDFTDPNSRATTARQSQSDLFIRQLQSRLLSSLAGEVTEAIFGDGETEPRESGTIRFGDQTISFLRGMESVQLEIVNAADGSVTEIEIPLFFAE